MSGGKVYGGVAYEWKEYPYVNFLVEGYRALFKAYVRGSWKEILKVLEAFIPFLPEYKAGSNEILKEWAMKELKEIKKRTEVVVASVMSEVRQGKLDYVTAKKEIERRIRSDGIYDSILDLISKICTGLEPFLMGRETYELGLAKKVRKRGG